MSAATEVFEERFGLEQGASAEEQLQALQDFEATWGEAALRERRAILHRQVAADAKAKAEAEFALKERLAHANIPALEEAMDEVLGAMKTLVEARAKLALLRAEFDSLRREALTAGVPFEPVPTFGELLGRMTEEGYAARKLQEAFQSTIRAAF